MVEPMGNKRCSPIGDLRRFRRQHGFFLDKSSNMKQTSLVITSTPRFRATAMTVLSVPKSTPTTDMLAKEKRLVVRWESGGVSWRASMASRDQL